MKNLQCDLRHNRTGRNIIAWVPQTHAQVGKILEVNTSNDKWEPYTVITVTERTTTTQAQFRPR